MKDNEYETFADLQEAVDEMNKKEVLGSLNDFEYRIKLTPKYARLHCSKCGLFQAWFKSSEGKDVSDFCRSSKELVLNDDARPKFKLFRKINQCHDAAKHQMTQVEPFEL